MADWSARSLDDAWVERALQLRAWAIALAVRHAHAAVAAGGARANTRDHSAQRLYREALLYTVLTQTQAVQAATLTHLVRPTRDAGGQE